MLFTSDFFTDCPTFQLYARRGKTRQSLGKGLAVFADMAFKVGSMKVPKGDFMALSGMSERTLNYYGGIKGISYILRKSSSEAGSRLTGDQIASLRKIGIGAIAMSSSAALVAMKGDPDLSMRREGWSAGGFVMLEANEEGEDCLMFTNADGIDEPYTLSIADMTTDDWVKVS